MHIEATHISDVMIVSPRRLSDARGFFMESFRQDIFESAIGRPILFKQDNRSLSRTRHTVRGLHFQAPPFAQEKLVQCTRGAILDIAVDIRKGSSTFGQHVKMVLSEENAKQLFVPAGFLHGFITLQQNTEVQYKCTGYYAPGANKCVQWNDPRLAIDWGVPAQDVTLSQQDSQASAFDSFLSPFEYSEGT